MVIALLRSSNCQCQQNRLCAACHETDGVFQCAARGAWAERHATAGTGANRMWNPRWVSRFLRQGWALHPVL